MPNKRYWQRTRPLNRSVGVVPLVAIPPQRMIHKPIMRCVQPFKGAPVHPFGLSAIAIQNARFPAKSIAKFVGLPRGPIVRGLPLASVSQPLAALAREHAPAVVAGSPVLRHGIAHGAPLAAPLALPVVQPGAVGFHLHENR